MAYDTRSLLAEFCKCTRCLVLVLFGLASSFASSADKPVCKWGDCKDGLGEKVYSSGNSAISNFEGGLRSGYTIEFFKNGLVCESRFIKGKSNSLRYCQTEQGSRSYSYYERNKRKSGSSHLAINSKGKLTSVGRWYPSGGTSPAEIDITRLSLDHIVLRRTGLSLADRLPTWYSSPSDNETLLDEKLMREFVSGRDKTAFEIADEKFAREKTSKNCAEGDCRNGLGHYVWNDGNFTIANYVDSKREGYGVYSSKSGDTECERIYRKNTVNGLSVCKTVYKGKARAHFSYMVDGKRDKDDLLLIADSEGNVITYSPVSKNPDEDYKRLQRDYEAIRSTSKPSFRDELSEEFRRIGLPSKASFDSHIKAKSTKTQDKSDATCEFGDCKNGFGSYRFKSGDQHVGYFKNSRQHGYGILVQEQRPGRKRVCETRYQEGRRTGLAVCLNHGTDVATAYYYSNGDKANGRGISWNASSRQIVKLGLWRNNKFIREEPADLRQIASDWQSIKDSPQAVMRASFLTDEFLALELPSQDDQSEWLRQKELERTKTTHVIPEEAPFKLGCISGDCEDGFGEFATPDTTLAGTFKNRRVSGYTLITSSEQQCEARMRGGFHAGLEHCVDIQSGNHSFAYRYKAGLQRAKITISPNGDLVSYRVYENDEEIRISFSSKAEKQELAAVEFENFYGDLIKFKRKAPREARVLRVASLEKIPPIRFGSNVDDAYELPIEKPKTVSKPKTLPKTKLPEATKSNAKVATKPSSVAPPKPAQAVSKSESDKPQSNLQRLAYIVAELNAGSRQINFNYRLDKVRIDPNAFELVYEFTAMAPIRELDTSVISVANQTAYCTSSKLKPFRDENMPARWAYVDSEDQTFEVITGVSDCS